jgi:hypothetical protein
VNAISDAHEQPRPRSRIDLARRSTVARAALVTLALLLLTAVSTWPHFERFGSTVLGNGGDVPESIRLLWAVDAQGGSTFTTARDHLLAAPGGVPVLRTAAIAAPLFSGVLLALGHVGGWVVAINAYNIAAFVLSGTAMFVLLELLDVGMLAAVFGTYVFTFNPNHVEKAFGAAPLAATGILPLLLLALIRMRRQRTVRRGLIVGGLLVVAFYLDPYLGLLASWLMLAFVAVDLVRRTVNWYELLRSYYIVAGVWVIGMVPVAFAWAADSASVATFAAGRNVPLVGGSARLETYFLPGPRNPWLGGPMRSWLTTHLSWEPTMFVGYTTMILAVAGVAVAVMKRRRGTLGRDEGMLVAFACILLVSAAIASLPPKVTIIGVALPTPQWFLFRLTAVYRVYSRFGVLVGFGFILLAVYALSQLPKRGLALLVPLVALVAVAVELYVPRPNTMRVEQIQTPVNVAQLAKFESGTPVVALLSRPPRYVTWLRLHATSIVADYPGPAAPDGRWAWKDIYEQYNHHLALWQMADGEIDQSGTRELASDLNARVATSVLAVEGVRWVVVHRERYRVLGLPLPKAGCGLQEEASFPAGVVVYRVTASRDAAWVSRTGFESLYNAKLWPESLGLRWMHETARLSVYSARATTVKLSTFAVSLGKNRTLTVVDEQGHIVGSTEVSQYGGTVAYQLPVMRGFSDFTLLASPGDQPRGEGDPRSVSIALAPFDLTVDGKSGLPRCPAR